MDGMTAEAIIAVSAAVVALVQLVKWSGMLPDSAGPIAVLVCALLGVLIWSYSQPTPFDRTLLFSYFAGWITIATSAAGIFGFTRATSNAVTGVNPSSGAGDSATFKG